MNCNKKINLLLFFIVFLFSFNSYAQNCQDFEISLSNTSPAQAADGHVYLCVGDTLDIEVTGNYPNDGISYSQADSLTDFLWFFHGGNGGAGGTNVSAIYDSPGIYPIICTAVDSANCQNTNEFVIYAIVSGPEFVELSTSLLPDSYCIGDSISLIAATNFDSLELVYSDTVIFTYDNDSLLFLPDGTGEVFEAVIDVPEFMNNSSLSLENLVVCLDIEHSFIGDLEIILTCPSGENIILHEFSNFSGGSYDLGQPVNNSEPIPGIPGTYCFSPLATNGNWLQSGDLVIDGALPPGNYSPFEPLSNLYSCDKSGEWTLSIEDLWSVDNGYLFSWSLGFIVNDSVLFEDVTFDSIGYLPTLTDQYWELPDGSTMNGSEILVEVTSDSLYTYTTIDELGCGFSYAIVIQPNSANPCNPCIPYTVTDTSFTICTGDTIQYLGNSFSEAGDYIVMPDSIYCQTQVAVTIDELPVLQDTTLYICPGDTTEYLGNSFSEAGDYTIMLNMNDCQDSVVVTIDETVLDYVIVTTPTLLGATEGIIEVVTPGYYIDSVGSLVSMLDSLAAGSYDIVVTDGTCSETITVEILDFNPLMVDVTVSANFTSSSTFTVTANISGGWPDYTIEWSTGNIGSAVSLSDLEAGEYWVKVTDALGNEVTHHFTVGTVSNQDLSDFESVKIFPNPTSNTLNIQVSFDEIHHYNISLYNVLGKQMFRMDGRGKEVSESKALQQMAEGIYLLEISVDGNAWVERITIQ